MDNIQEIILLIHLQHTIRGRDFQKLNLKYLNLLIKEVEEHVKKLC